jgi:hypothetical protein
MFGTSHHSLERSTERVDQPRELEMSRVRWYRTQILKMMFPMHWLLIASLLALTFVSCNANRVGDRGALRMAWIWFSAIPFSHFAMALFRAGSFRNPHDLALVEIWSDGLAWLFLGLSIFCLGQAFRGSSPS